MSSEASQEILLQGACTDLPPVVVDKYFTASYRDRPFEHLTAITICRRCVAQFVCLEDAIASTVPFDAATALTRGGLAATDLQEQRRQHFAEGIPSTILATMVLRQQPITPGIRTKRRIRKGRFPNAVPALPEMTNGQ